VASSRTILIAGAGIGGLTAALALAKQGFRAAVFEQSARLAEIGAGIQLSPNALHVLFSLGLKDALRPHIVAPENVRIRNASDGRDLAQVPLGAYAEERYGAPYWTIHRGDLQKVLLDAVGANLDITLTLDTRIEDCAIHAHGVTAQARSGLDTAAQHGIALIGADGLGSVLRARLGHRRPAVFRHRTAWRAVVSAGAAPEEFRTPSVHLWLGQDSHLVHYPVKAGTHINIVAIVADEWAEHGWDNAGSRDELLARFLRRSWAGSAYALLATPGQWSKWALYDRAPVARWGKGPATLLGDAAHPMLPFLAQGAALAIEDAAVLADCLARLPDDPAAGMRLYEKQRRRRTAKAQRVARCNGWLYHQQGLRAAARDRALDYLGGERLLQRYDWLYGWKPPQPEGH
jgi:salicylate hydroxylase